MDLFPFQRAGARFLAANHFAVLGDGPGLGKTLQVLTAIQALEPGRRHDSRCKRLRIVSTKVEMAQWLAITLKILGNELPDELTVVDSLPESIRSGDLGPDTVVVFDLSPSDQVRRWIQTARDGGARVWVLGAAWVNDVPAGAHLIARDARDLMSDADVKLEIEEGRRGRGG